MKEEEEHDQEQSRRRRTIRAAGEGLKHLQATTAGGGKETEAEPYRRRDREKREGGDGRGELCEGKARAEAEGIGKKETEEVGIE